MINTKKVNEILIRYVLPTALFIIGIIILDVRNPDPLLNPVIYAEDGTWTSLGFSKGWLYALAHARDDYFVFLNIALLFFSTKISYLITGNPLTLLPESIAITSFAFFSAVATAVFIVTKNVSQTVFRLALYLLLLLVPLGTTQNEIIGRLLQVGFFVPLISVLLFYLRDNVSSKHGRHVIDFFVLLCAATNPMIFALAFLYIFWDFCKEFDLRACVKRNITLLIPLGLLLAVLLPRMGVKGDIPEEFLSSNFIEAIIARPIAYPFVFPWYDRLSDQDSLIFFGIWICVIFFSYKKSTNSEAKRLILFLMTALLVCDLATIAMRPGLTGILSNYQTTFPDRYFMGLNVLAILSTMIALSQISINGNINYKIGSHLTLFLVVTVYAWQAPNIFEMHVSKTPIKRNFNFSEQLCMSQNIENSSIFLVQIYPDLPKWRMAIPTKFVDKSNCKFTSFDDVGIADTDVLYKLQPTAQLDPGSPIKIKMTPSSIDIKIGIKRIGIRFGTNAARNPGAAELRLMRADGSKFIQKFALEDLTDNGYHYFTLDSKHYIAGEIVFVTGGGIATWESQDDKRNTYTCIIYEYNNGKRRSTPGCPLF